jgi:FK506-binding protein 1
MSRGSTIAINLPHDVSLSMGKKKPAAARAPPVSLETLTPGDGKTKPKPGDSVTVHYVGTLVSDGSMFDSSREKKTPFSFKLGGGGVIKGWDLGIAQLTLGQRAKLTVAADAAYGAAGCVDKKNASGTGVIPPNADLCFDVELLDINYTAVLARFERTLGEWKAAKVTKFDADEQLRAEMETKHGSREGYVRHLEAVAAAKYDAERAKRLGAGTPTPAKPVSSTTRGEEASGTEALASVKAGMAAAVAAQAENPDAFLADFFAKRAASSSAATRGQESVGKKAEEEAERPAVGGAKGTGGGEAVAGAAGAPPAGAPPAPLKFDSRFAMFKVEPKDDGEGLSPNFPRSLHNAAELFVHLGHTDSAARLHACVARMLETLEAGPDGKSGQKLGRACVCWGCGHVGLPSNSAQCNEAGGSGPAGICGRCGDDAQSNFIKCVQKDGKLLPWIEGAPPLASQAATAEEAEAMAVALG